MTGSPDFRASRVQVQLEQNNKTFKEAHRHRHDAILVQGSRGTGKTTLLLTVHEALNAKKGSSAWHDNKKLENLENLDKVYALDPLDPTLVEGDEVFLATIVANILRAVHSKHTKGDLWKQNKALTEAFEQLGAGFRVLSSTATRAELERAPNNPHLFGERLLSNAMSGLDLSERFHDFCIEACRALNVRVLVQPLDDVDVAIGQGWDVLETVRRYLSNAHILPLMLGDLDLFRLVIKEEQLAKLERVRAASARSGAGSVEQRLVETLPEQYMLKLVRPERRIRLPEANRRLRHLKDSGEEVWLQPIDGEQIRLEELLSRVAERAFGIRSNIAMTGILPANTRELRGVLMWMTELPNADDPISGVMRRYHDVYGGLAARLDLDPDFLSGLEHGALDRWQRWLASVEHPERERLWRLTLHQESDAPTKVLEFLLSGTLFHRWRSNPSEQFRYFGAVLSPMTGWREIQGEEEEEFIVDAWRLGSGESAWHTAARVSVSLINPKSFGSTLHEVFFGPATRLPPRTDYRKPEFGRIVAAMCKYDGERRKKKKSKKKRYAMGIDPWLDILKQSTPEGTTIEDLLIPTLYTWEANAFDDAWFVLSWFRATPRRGARTYDLVDAWKGIAFIDELLETFRSFGSSSDLLSGALLELAVRSYLGTIPLGNDHEPEPLEDSSEAEAADVSDERQLSPEFTARLEAWASRFEEADLDAALPPSVWAEVASGFAENLFNIREDLAPVEHSVGADLERWVLAFLSNLLLAEARLRGLGSQRAGERLDPLYNIRAYDAQGNIRGPFKTNLGRVDLGEMPVFCLVAQCPMLTAVLSSGWRDTLKKRIGAVGQEVDFDAPTGTMFQQRTRRKLASGKIDQKVDVHTALCALVPRFSSKPEPKTRKELRQYVRELAGWSTGESTDADSEA